MRAISHTATKTTAQIAGTCNREINKTRNEQEKKAHTHNTSYVQIGAHIERMGKTEKRTKQ